MIEIRRMEPDEYAACGEILRSLPDWFGIEQAIVEYVRDVRSMETWIAEAESEVIGFLTLNRHNDCSAEIQVMAVRERFHGQGVGRRLVDRAERILRSAAVEFLQVKTLAPSGASAAYERTRLFYEAMGFRPLEENSQWGEGNPCLVMVKHLLCRGNSA